MNDRRDERRAQLQAGFTILELMFVVATLCVVMGVVVASIVPATRRFELNNGVRGVSAFLKHCRSEAVRLNTAVTCRWVALNGGRMFWIDRNGDSTQQATEPGFFLTANMQLNPAGAPGPASTGFANATQPNGTTGIVFNPRGGVTYPVGNPTNPFILSFRRVPAEGFRAVTVTQLGAISVWTATQSSAPWVAL